MNDRGPELKRISVGIEMNQVCRAKNKLSLQLQFIIHNRRFTHLVVTTNYLLEIRSLKIHVIP